MWISFALNDILYCPEEPFVFTPSVKPHIMQIPKLREGHHSQFRARLTATVSISSSCQTLQGIFNARSLLGARLTGTGRRHRHSHVRADRENAEKSKRSPVNLGAEDLLRVAVVITKSVQSHGHPVL